MELREPRRKKRSNFKILPPLPLIKKPGGEIRKFSGHFNGFSVVVQGEDEIKKLNSMGFFGKANLSRGYPSFNPRNGQDEVVRRRVFNRRKEGGPSGDPKRVRKVIVVPDSSSDDEDYFTNLKPEYQLDSSCLKEALNLALEEAFFLQSSLQCLDIYDRGELLPEKKSWEVFRETDQFFTQNYPVYYHFRSKRWVVKSGIKFAGDFLLYKDGPPFYHASCLVIIDVLDSKTLERRDDLCRRSMEMINFLGLNRLCETVGKDLLICQLLWPEELISAVPEDMTRLSINETIMRRWIPSQNRDLS